MKEHSHGGGAERPASHLHPLGSTDLADHAVPTGREEIWRFTPLKRLRDLHKESDLDGSADGVEVTSVDSAVRVESLPADTPGLKGGSGYLPTDRVSARVWNAAESVLRVTIPKEVETSTATVVQLSGTEAGRAGHLLVEAEPFAKATVVLDHQGAGVRADNVEIVVGESAHLTFVTVQDWESGAVHHANQHARVGRDATLRHIAVSFGGDLVRVNSSMEYDGPGGEIESLGLYFVDSSQHIEHRLFVDHNQPNTKSDVDYKGALQGDKAHAVWIGDILIRKVAEGINTYEHNRNLMLTDHCRADSVPNLEIETGEIEGAGHASATGRFDEEQLFYLQSRGVPEQEARRLVVFGYFADIIRRIGIPELEDRLMRSVEVELEKGSVLAPASAGGV